MDKYFFSWVRAADRKISINKIYPTLEFENYIRQVYSNTVDVQIDSQGRFVIPQFLKEQVGIEKDVLFMGVGTHIEIWSREAFQEKQKTIDMNEMKKLMIQMGF